jgi:hypothetical protein
MLLLLCNIKSNDMLINNEIFKYITYNLDIIYINIINYNTRDISYYYINLERHIDMDFNNYGNFNVNGKVLGRSTISCNVNFTDCGTIISINSNSRGRINSYTVWKMVKIIHYKCIIMNVVIEVNLVKYIY